MTFSRVADTWRPVDAQALWRPRTVTGALLALVRRLRPGRRAIHLPRVSPEWLRAHEMESSKHRHDY